MRLFPSHLFRGWRVALVAAVAACAAPSAAQAGCGDYVVVRDATGEPVAAPDHGDTLPCHGPNCTGSPTRDPLAPAAPPAPHAGAKECVAFGATTDPSATPTAFPIPTSDACPSGPASAIFHPPRAG